MRLTNFKNNTSFGERTNPDEEAIRSTSCHLGSAANSARTSLFSGVVTLAGIGEKFLPPDVKQVK
jgi:hypothetical protein